jgi:hypothetical protein
MNILTLRLYRGKENYDKKGNLTSENQLYKIPHGTPEWDQFKRNVGLTFTKIELIEVNKQTAKRVEVETLSDKKAYNTEYSYEKIAITPELQKEVDSILGTPEIELTPDQKRIAELEAKLELLIEGKKDGPETPTDLKPELTAEQIESIKDEYTSLFGAKPHHKKGIEAIIAEIEEFKKAN